MTRTPHDLLDALTALDPVDADGLAAGWARSRTAPALLADLTSQTTDDSFAADPARRPRRWARTAVVAAAAASVALGLIVIGLPGSTNRAYGFRQLDDGRIVIDWRADRNRGRELVEDLRDYGLDVEIVAEVPASPSMVGVVQPQNLNTDDANPRWWPPGVTLGGPDGSPKPFTWTIDPAVFDTTIPVHLYVATPPGEDYQVAGSVFEPGEPLAESRCGLPQPLPPAEAAALAGAAGLTVTWTVETPTAYQP
ncbi:MAG: hypothetical protein MUF09_12495, partial [Candidatus Nanopelagicales bacterium]|nr:hypothetical protein [Candidatus Nanopelagicales bacterium]